MKSYFCWLSDSCIYKLAYREECNYVSTTSTQESKLTYYFYQQNTMNKKPCLITPDVGKTLGVLKSHITELGTPNQHLIKKITTQQTLWKIWLTITSTQVKSHHWKNGTIFKWKAHSSAKWVRTKAAYSHHSALFEIGDSTKQFHRWPYWLLHSESVEWEQ